MVDILSMSAQASISNAFDKMQSDEKWMRSTDSYLVQDISCE